MSSKIRKNQDIGVSKDLWPVSRLLKAEKESVWPYMGTRTSDTTRTINGRSRSILCHWYGTARLPVGDIAIWIPVGGISHTYYLLFHRYAVSFPGIGSGPSETAWKSYILLFYLISDRGFAYTTSTFHRCHLRRIGPKSPHHVTPVAPTRSHVPHLSWR